MNAYGTSTGTLTLTVFATAAARSAASGVTAPVITSAAAAAGHAGEAFSYLVSATYNGLPYLAVGSGYNTANTWTFSATGLPPGLSLSSTSVYNYGVTSITGTPTTAGTYQAAITASVPANTILPYTRSAGSTTAIVTFIIQPGPVSVPTFGIAAGQSVQATMVEYYNFPTKATNTPTSYAASGLPPGVSINATNGNLNGTPTTAGTYPVVLSATNAAGTGSAQVTFVITPPPAPYIISAAAANGTVGSSSFSYTISTNTNPAASYGASGLPPGLSCNATNGKITGTPTTAGVYPVTISGTDASGNTASATLMITIASTTPGLPILSNAGTVQGTVGSSFTFGLYSSPYATSFAASGLPPGLSVTASSGQITGTPTTPGTYSVPISATNGTGTGNATLTIIIVPKQPPVFASSGVVNDIIGTALSYTTTASNAPTSYAAGNLPPGVTINPSTGLVSGTPTTAGTYSVSLTATNAAGTGSATLTIFVTAATPTSATLTSSNPLTQSVQVGVSAYAYIYTSGSPTSYAASGLPPGLTVNTTNGYISGTPTTAGTYPVTISETSATGTSSAMVAFIVTNPPPAFTSLAAAVPGVVNASFNTTLTATNNPTSYAATGLPPGLTLNPATGLVSGTPTALGTYSVNVSATNAAGTGNAVWTVNIGTTASVIPTFSYSFAGSIGIVGGSLPDSALASASGLPLTYTFSGGPPGTVGRVDDEGYAYFSGKLTATGTYTGTITATTPYGGSSSIQVKYVIAPALLPAVSSAASVSGNVGSALTYNVTSDSTITSYAASHLPLGLVFNTATGVITGTPTTTGTYSANVMVTSATGTGSAVVTFIIAGSVAGGLPVINSAAEASCQDILLTSYPYYSPYGGNETMAFSYAITAINASTSFGATNLPAGLSLNPSTGVISGQPLVGGTFQVPITATNATGTSSATLTINATATVPSISNALVVSGSAGSSLSATLGTNVTTLYGASYYQVYGSVYDPLMFAAVTLPPGLSLNTSTGSITGVPTQAGTYPVTVTVTNRAGTGSAVVTFAIAPTAPAATTPPSFYGAAMVQGYAGFPLSTALTASGATSYAVGGALPAGLNFDPTTGYVTGTPAQTGVFSVPVSATNAVGTAQAVLTFAVDATPPSPIIASVAGSNATIGTPFVYAITTTAATAGSPTVTAYGASNLPAGLSINQRTGFITGTPAGPAGTFQIPTSASLGTITGTGTLTLTVLSAPVSQPVLTNTASALGFVDNPLAYALGNAGFTPTTMLPGGLSFDPATGAITGYPASAGTYQISLATPGARGNSMAIRKSRSRASITSHALATSMTSSGSTAVLTLNVLAPDLSLPRLTGQPTGATVLQNGSVTFAATAVGAPLPAYQWARNGVPLAGATAATLTLAQVQPSDAGTYMLTATNAAGQTVSVPAVLTVQQTYATWQAAHFTAAEIGAGLAVDGADLVGDGVPNLLKYALGIDPIIGTGGGLPVGTYSTANGVLQLAFTRDIARTDINYVVEASPDLSQWTPIASSTSGSPTANLGGALAVIENAVPGTTQVNVVVESSQSEGNSGQQFLRLKVVRP